MWGRIKKYRKIIQFEQQTGTELAYDKTRIRTIQVYQSVNQRPEIHDCLGIFCNISKYNPNNSKKKKKQFTRMYVDKGFLFCQFIFVLGLIWA